MLDWKIFFVVALMGFLSYLFGFWDRATHSIEPPLILRLIILVLMYVIGTGGLYITFALWHKWLYPCIFS